MGAGEIILGEDVKRRVDHLVVLCTAGSERARVGLRDLFVKNLEQSRLETGRQIEGELTNIDRVVFMQTDTSAETAYIRRVLLTGGTRESWEAMDRSDLDFQYKKIILRNIDEARRFLDGGITALKGATNGEEVCRAALELRTRWIPGFREALLRALSEFMRQDAKEGYDWKKLSAE